MELSPVFDPITGFGGNGANGTVPLGNQNFSAIPPGSCVGDGPFVGLSSNLGPGFNLDTPRPHCIIRNFNTSLFDSALQWEKNVVPLLRIQDYANFTYQFDFPSTGAPTGIHGGGHGGVSGEVSAVSISL
jgi:tyrosinase